ncbi:response regulator [Halobacteriovorax sp.]|uniref:response regulator n=1 Tax=Halobacteriovorax sp. TaxID=2020862 RepID=UPI003AF25C67
MNTDRKKVILVAEDEPILNEMYVEAFESLGYKTVGVYDGHQALAFAKENQVDFLVTDLKMPKMDGITLIEELRKIHPEIPPVLIITGFIDEANTLRAKELGALDLMTKPFDFDNVIGKIEKTFDQAS